MFKANENSKNQDRALRRSRRYSRRNGRVRFYRNDSVSMLVA